MEKNKNQIMTSCIIHIKQHRFTKPDLQFSKNHILIQILIIPKIQKHNIKFHKTEEAKIKNKAKINMPRNEDKNKNPEKGWNLPIGSACLNSTQIQSRRLSSTNHSAYLNKWLNHSTRVWNWSEKCSNWGMGVGGGSKYKSVSLFSGVLLLLASVLLLFGCWISMVMMIMMMLVALAFGFFYLSFWLVKLQHCFFSLLWFLMHLLF